MASRATITSKGRITIPVDVRRQLGLRSGELVELDVDGGTAILRRAPNERNPFAAYAGALCAPTDDAIEAWLRDVREDDEGYAPSSTAT